MGFPDQGYASIASFFDAYSEQMAAALASVDRAALDAAQALIQRTIASSRLIYACGNGGSAAISNHLVCDHSKGVHASTGLRPRVYSLAATVETITALANDLSYAEVFAGQLKLAARSGDLLITISSSGDSENVVRALQWAKENEVGSIAMTGFSGGRSAKLADINLHVRAENYGVVEDVHQCLMHALAQYIRLSNLSIDDPQNLKF
jgi:phosphoheptose isomerase